jgi:hypothetical protein
MLGMIRQGAGGGAERAEHGGQDCTPRAPFNVALMAGGFEARDRSGDVGAGFVGLGVARRYDVNANQVFA